MQRRSLTQLVAVFDCNCRSPIAITRKAVQRTTSPLMQEASVKASIVPQVAFIYRRHTMSTVTSNCQTFRCSLGAMCRIAGGVACLFSGLVLTVTFWLMFIGIPLALLGVALLAADPN